MAIDNLLADPQSQARSTNPLRGVERIEVLAACARGHTPHKDTLGHQHGDEVLKAVATCLQQQQRPTDLITRYGGEEFAIATIDTPGEGARVLAERLRSELRNIAVADKAVTISIGIAEIIAVLAQTHGYAFGAFSKEHSTSRKKSGFLVLQWLLIVRQKQAKRSAVSFDVLTAAHGKTAVVTLHDLEAYPKAEP